jgi:hypothetical protein
VIASPRASNIAINNTGMAHNICQANGIPINVRITKKTAKVGKNLMIEIITADIGSMIRGNAVFKIKRCPAVIDFTPPVREFDTK